MQKTLVQVIFEAAIEISRKYKISIIPEIMVPLVAMSREFIAMSRLIDDAAQSVDHDLGASIHYKVGVHDRAAESGNHCRTYRI